jgi:glycosyltransferase involved in cell wall biosynthesis
MRILMTTPILPDPQASNAGPLVFYGQLRAMAERHEVTLVSFADDTERDRAALRAIASLGVRCRIAAAPGLQGTRSIRRCGQALEWLSGKYPLRTLWFRTHEMQALLDAVGAEHCFDLLHVADNAMSVYRYPDGAPSLLTETEVRSPAPARHWKELGAARHFRPLTAALDAAEQRRWDAYQLRAWRRSHHIQVFTRRDAARISTLDPSLAERVSVNPFGFDPPAPGAHQEERMGAVVFVGGFLHRPNVDAALWLAGDIMPRLRAMSPGVRLTIVGGDPPEAVRSLASSDIEVTGRVPSVEPYLARASVVIAPLRSGGGMRQKVLEAMAMGKAVVTTPLGADGLDGTGTAPPIVIAEDAEELAAATAALLASGAIRAELGSRARAFVMEHFTWKAHAERLERVIGKILEERIQVSRTSGK